MQRDKIEKKKNQNRKGGMQKCIACYYTLQVGEVKMLFLLVLSADHLCRHFEMELNRACFIISLDLNKTVWHSYGIPEKI